jgi:hypothetical protein
MLAAEDNQKASGGSSSVLGQNPVTA